MVRFHGTVALALAALLFAAGCDDDGDSSGEGVCSRYCAWDEACSARDGESPAPFADARRSASPAPIGDGGTGPARSGCVDDCMDDYQASACLRRALPGCTRCLEATGCESRPCLEECLEVEDCGASSNPEPYDPPAPGEQT